MDLQLNMEDTENIVLSERSQSPQTTCHMLPFTQNVQNPEIQIESMLVTARIGKRGLWWGGEE